MRLTQRDQQSVWHPFTQHAIDTQRLDIVKGEGAYLFDEYGKKYLDLVSSWWVTLHGHSHPMIAKAIAEQAAKLDHVMFAGFTHEPAVALAELLLQILPAHFSKVFYSDNGSTSVEVAVKMACQYWYNLGEPQRKRFIAFEQGYHGDTFGAMSVGKAFSAHEAYKDLFFDVDLLPYPATWLHDNTIAEREKEAFAKIDTYLERHGKQTAAMIIEPLVQGASGMRMCRAEFLQGLEKRAREYGVLVIYDEVFTGFGRTGEMFACTKAKTSPDIICLSKSLTGGFLPLAATVCHERIYEAFLGAGIHQALVHGHSYTANPIGCAAALASTQLLREEATQEKIRRITQINSDILSSMTEFDKPRFCGTIAAFDMRTEAYYGSAISRKCREHFIKHGLIVRPLGNVIFFIPPLCIDEVDLRRAYETIMHEFEGITA